MSRIHDDDEHSSEATRDSATRFGPRRVPEGQRRDGIYSGRPLHSSRIIPSGDLSPDGRSAWPQPSLTARIIVWGGVAAAAAAVTAGGVIALRRISGIEGTQGGAQRSAHHLAPRFDDLDEDAREALRGRVLARARDDSRQAAADRANAARLRNPPRRNAAVELTETATGLASGLNGLMISLQSAFDGFRSVAAQASGIVTEFASAAEQLRNLLHRDPPRREDDPRRPL